ncbi:hypothetical protein [uncultured Paenibacillus sp.]|uniref:hypothetical protein n=1 Tax=uncultured Paenibacillus sp. TaxID=227322 RepID=UPI0015AC7911|nr:hypothetical protein [uncultured Paenibacillus sp.]
MAYQTGLPANEADIALERTLIHHLSDLEDDEELQELVSFIADNLETTSPPILEKDAWTVWLARKK